MTNSKKNKSVRKGTSRIPFVTPILIKAAKHIGAKILIEPEFNFVGHVLFKNGKTTFFRNTNFSINPLGSIEIARDKGYAAFFLEKFGFPIPEGKTFFNKRLCKHITDPRNIDDGFKYANEVLGLPVIIKPNSKSRGTLVVKVYSKKEYYKAAKEIFKIDSVMLVQKYYEGNDYRIVVLDDEVISAYQRLPLTVIGNGFSTIKELLLEKQKYFCAVARDTVIDLEDFRIANKLKRNNLDFSSILPNNKMVELLDNANLSTGGNAVDFTESIHSAWVKIAVDVTSKMGLRLCGVDIITKDITRPSCEYIILEINGAPGLDNYASIGKKQSNIVDKLYEKILMALER